LIRISKALSEYGPMKSLDEKISGIVELEGLLLLRRRLKEKEKEKEDEEEEGE
jgi:hypothetical protein